MLRRSLHSVRPSHCPDSRNEQHKRPTLNDIYLIIYSSHGAFAVAFDPDYPLEVAKFYRVKVKALSKRLFSVCHPTHPMALLRIISVRQGQSYDIFQKQTRNMDRNFILFV
jgi:hypothetical protein